LASATIDHLISITIFLAAILLFINLFSQTNQTAIIYQQHRALATKCSDLIDNVLLNPGNPSIWGKENGTPTGFGVQDPEFTQYQLSPFSLLRLASSTADTIVYNKTYPSVLYSQTSMGVGSCLLMPNDESVNYSTALKLLGINDTYGFQLTLTPIITISTTETQAANPLKLSLSATGTGSPLAGATVSYIFIKVNLPAEQVDYPSFTLQNGTAIGDAQGSVSLQFPQITDQNQAYALIAYAHLGGLVGVGQHERVSSTDQYLVPMISDLSQQKVLLAHSYDLNSSNPACASLKYNATFVLLAEDFTLREMPLDSPNMTGSVVSGVNNPYINVTIPTYTPGILIVTYQESATQGGIILMPWGVSALAYPVTFGGDPLRQEWVTTDIRQVTVNHVSYQAKLALWSNEQKQVVPQR
jgi:hypothetical protein